MININIKSIKCCSENCQKNGYYYNLNNIDNLYCFDHKTLEMKNNRKDCCIFENCIKYPTYNYQGEIKKLYCVEHKLENMIDIKHDKCIFEGCNIRPSFNFSGENNLLYCGKHKLENMVDIKHQKCKIILCNTRSIKKYEDYCFYCYVHTFPDKPVSRNYKTKERTVVEYILENFKDYTWILDKKIIDGCSKRRPDLLLDLGYQIIIIEIDENQHDLYDCSCENKRIMEISQDLNHRPIIFIRFNPDDYLENSKKNPSCWTVNKKGLCVVSKSKIEEWNYRLNILKNTISYWILAENKTNKTVETIQLFFDN